MSYEYKVELQLGEDYEILPVQEIKVIMKEEIISITENNLNSMIKNNSASIKRKSLW